jgi:hypothetical protein
MDAVAWLTVLVQDLEARLSSGGINWTVDRTEVPLRARVDAVHGPVAGPGIELELTGDDPVARVVFIGQLQQVVYEERQISLPPCPEHGIGLRAVADGNDVRWRCPHGDWDCAIGEYDEPFWPVYGGEAAPMLGRRFDRRGVTGLMSWGVSNGAVQAHVHEGADEVSIRAAAAPLPVDITWIPHIGWARRDEPEGEMLTITNTPMLLARLAGELRRSSTGTPMVGDVAVHLSFEHRLGGPGEPLILDPDGVRFADQGDEVICCGGFSRGPVQGQETFYVGSIVRVAAA